MSGFVVQVFFFFSSRRRHTRFDCDWSSDVCSSDLVARAGLRAAGRLSRGVDLGWRNGFDSGLSLDYVYENKPRGLLGVGRLIEKTYFNIIGRGGVWQSQINL